MNKKLILSALLFSTVLGTAMPHSLVAAERPTGEHQQGDTKRFITKVIAGGLAGIGAGFLEDKYLFPFTSNDKLPLELRILLGLGSLVLSRVALPAITTGLVEFVINKEDPPSTNGNFASTLAHNLAATAYHIYSFKTPPLPLPSSFIT